MRFTVVRLKHAGGRNTKTPLTTLMPPVFAACARFASDEELEELFYRAFDGLEVLPHSLYEDYKAVCDDEPIRAGELLVPISWGRYHALRNDDRILPRTGNEPYRVKAAYDSEVGLTFD